MSAPSSSEPLERRAEAFLGAAFLLSMATLTYVSCACGHLGVIALPTSSLAAGVAGYAFVRLPRANGSQVFVWVCSAFCWFVFVKNVSDVLWFGHAPWLR
jgi:hypothetical protein